MLHFGLSSGGFGLGSSGLGGGQTSTIDGDIFDDPVGLVADLLGELLAAELAAYNHLVQLVLELHLLNAEILCSST